MTRTIYFTGGIKLVNDGYKNKIIDESNNGILDEITGTLEGAILFTIEEYSVKVK